MTPDRPQGDLGLLGYKAFEFSSRQGPAFSLRQDVARRRQNLDPILFPYFAIGRCASSAEFRPLLENRGGLSSELLRPLRTMLGLAPIDFRVGVILIAPHAQALVGTSTRGKADRCQIDEGVAIVPTHEHSRRHPRTLEFGNQPMQVRRRQPRNGFPVGERDVFEEPVSRRGVLGLISRRKRRRQSAEHAIERCGGSRSSLDQFSLLLFDVRPLNSNRLRDRVASRIDAAGLTALLHGVSRRAGYGRVSSPEGGAARFPQCLAHEG